MFSNRKKIWCLIAAGLLALAFMGFAGIITLQ